MEGSGRGNTPPGRTVSKERPSTLEADKPSVSTVKSPGILGPPVNENVIDAATGSAQIKETGSFPQAVPPAMGRKAENSTQYPTPEKVVLASQGPTVQNGFSDSSKPSLAKKNGINTDHWGLWIP